MRLLNPGRRVAALALLALMAAGCGIDAPSAPPVVGPTATASRDGLLMTLELERAPLAAGRRVWARVTVANSTPVVRHYQGGGCDFLATLQIVTAAPVKPEPGRDWEGPADFFKTLVWSPPPAEATAFFVDERFVDRGGGIACTADLGVNEIQPGERLEMKAAWDGEVSGAVAAAGRARVMASFPYLGPADGREMVGRPPQPIEATIEVDVVDAGVRLLSPGQAIDAALADPGFAAWLKAEPRDRWQGVSLEMRGQTIDVILDSGIDRGVASVDRVTGTVAFAKRPRP